MRTEARVHTRIWTEDSDFCALDAGPQRVYLLIISQQQLNFCGVIPYTPRRWAGLARNTTVKSVQADVAALRLARFVVVDEDTEELWVRSSIKWDGVMDQPNVVVLMTRDFPSIQSPLLRDAFLDGLGDGWADGIADRYPKAWADGLWDRFHLPFREAYVDRFGDPSVLGSRDASEDGPRVRTRRPPPPPPSPPPPPRGSANGSAHPSPGPRLEEEAEARIPGGIVEAAFRVLAERRAAATAKPIVHRPRWLKATIEGLARDYPDARALAEAHRFTTGEQLADWLEPVRKRPVDPTEATAAAARKLAARSDQPPCDTCGQRGGAGFVDPGDGFMVPCPTCNTAKAAAK